MFFSAIANCNVYFVIIQRLVMSISVCIDLSKPILYLHVSRRDQMQMTLKNNVFLFTKEKNSQLVSFIASAISLVYLCNASY